MTGIKNSLSLKPMAGKKLPNGVILVYFGRWYTLGEVEKIIREYVEPCIKEHLGE